MKLFYFFAAIVAAKDNARSRRAPNTAFVDRLEELQRIATTCPGNLPIRATQKPVGRHITRKLEQIHSKAKKLCQVQQQVCIDAYGEWKKDTSRANVNESNACDCIIDVVDEYSRFFNHAKQNGISNKGKDHGNQRQRVEQLKGHLIDKLKTSYGCSLFSSSPIFQ